MQFIRIMNLLRRTKIFLYHLKHLKGLLYGHSVIANTIFQDSAVPNKVHHATDVYVVFRKNMHIYRCKYH